MKRQLKGTRPKASAPRVSRNQYRPELEEEGEEHDHWLASLTDEDMTRMAKRLKAYMKRRSKA